MIITWGMKSYHYFIGFKDDFPSSIMQDKYRTNFYGSYKISENFEELHYIDGIYFEDWINNIEYKKNFIDKISIPKNISKIDGFYYLRLVVYVIDKDFLGNFISPICFLILEEERIERKTNPLLNFSIF